MWHFGGNVCLGLIGGVALYFFAIMFNVLNLLCVPPLYSLFHHLRLTNCIAIKIFLSYFINSARIFPKLVYNNNINIKFCLTNANNYSTANSKLRYRFFWNGTVLICFWTYWFEVGLLTELLRYFTVHAVISEDGSKVSENSFKMLWRQV